MLDCGWQACLQICYRRACYPIPKNLEASASTSAKGLAERASFAGLGDADLAPGRWRTGLGACGASATGDLAGALGAAAWPGAATGVAMQAETAMASGSKAVRAGLALALMARQSRRGPR